MNSLERTRKAIRHERIDRFPVFSIVLAPACQLMGVKQKDFFTSSKVLADTLMGAQKLLDSDGIYVSRDNWVYHEALGGTLDYPDDDETFSKQVLLSSVQEFGKLKVPDPWHSPGMKTVLEAASQVVEATNGELYIQANIDTGPFTLAAILRGAQSFLFDLYDTPPTLLHEFMEFCSSVVIAYGKAMIGTGVHGIQMGEATASLLNEALFAQYVTPYVNRTLVALENQTCDRWVHVCGKTDHLLSELRKMPMEGLELDSPTDLRIARQIIGGNIALKGNMDTSSLLMDSPQEIYEESKRILSNFPDKTGLVFSAGCGVPRMTPQENLLAMAQAAKDHPLS